MNFRAHALLDHSARLNTDYRLGYEDGTEPPGQKNQLFPPRQPAITFERWNAGWTITYSAAQASEQLLGVLSASDQRFLTPDALRI